MPEPTTTEPTATERSIVARPLSREAFAPFGDVIEAAGASFPINDGMCDRFHDQARMEFVGDGRAGISVGYGRPYPLPHAFDLMERHPLGSQAFMPLGDAPYLVVVAPDPASPPRAFLARAGQGVSFRPGTWHHALLALERESDFLVVDRAGTAPNCDEVALPQPWTIASAD